MYIKKYFKKRMIISITTVLLIAIVILGSSYALFMDVKSNNEDQVITVGDLVINFSGGSTITIDPIEPMEDAEGLGEINNKYSFTINNVGNLSYCYTVSIENNPAYLSGGINYNASRILLDHNYIRYSVDSGIPATLGEQNNGIVYTGTLKPNKAKLFNLSIWVADATEYNLPNEALGSEVHLNINVDGKACDGIERLANVILEQGGGTGAIEAKGNPDFANIPNSDSSDTGLYAIADNYGMSYYYRGLKTELNNNLIFGGFQWKIIRINGDGSVRIIYNGTCPGNEVPCNGTGINNTHASTAVGSTSILNAGSSYAHAWNISNYNDAKYVGYMYGGANGTVSTQKDGNTSVAATYNETSSNAKTQLDNWYATNILGTANESKVVDIIFCNDRYLQSGDGYGSVATKYPAYNRLNTNKLPSLLCSQKNDCFTVSETTLGNGALTYPIGLITADEVALAGGTSFIGNNDYYLNTNQQFWTMSPSESSGSNGAREFSVTSSGYLFGSGNNNSHTYGLRPVLNLSASTIISSGDGSSASPFIIAS